MGLNLAKIQQDNYEKYLKEVENSYTNVNGLKISKIPSQSSNKTLFNKPTSNNVVANALGTVADIASQAGAGLGSFFETPLDLGANIIAGGLKLIGADDSAEKVRNFANMDISGNVFGRNDEVMQQQAKDYSYLGDYGKDIAYTVGNVAAMAAGSQALSALGGTANLGKVSANAANVAVNIGKHTLNLPTFAMAAGLNAGFKEADEKGANEAQRWAKAITSGLSEGISEGLFGFLGVGGNDITDTLTKTLVDKVPTTVGKVFTRLGINATGEGIEEVVSYLGEWMADNAIVDKLGDADFKKKWDNGEVLEQFALAAASTLLTGGFDTRITTNNAVQAAEQQLGRKLTNAEKVKVTQAALAGNEANLTPGQTTMAQIQNPSVEDIVEKKPVEKITVQELVNQEKNGNNTVNLPQAKYQFTMGSNEKLNALHESMAKYFNNSIETQELAKTIDKIIEDKNYNVTFDNSIVNVNGQPVNAQITTGTNGEVNIKINPNSPRAAEFLMVHEITHAIETNTMKDLVLDYANKNAEFRNALEELKKTYGTNDVSSEVLADISGQLFGNQEFINSLSIEKPNIFRRLYNAIISLANKITGNSNQALFIQDLKNKWQEAYRTQQNNLKETQYSMDENGYRGSHQLQNTESIVSLDLKTIQDKVIEANGGLSKQDYSDLNKLKKMLNNPNEKVKVYRAAPVNELNSGDWVTLDRSYALNVAQQNGGKVYTFEVMPSQLNYPNDVSELPSLHRLSTFQYNENTQTETNTSAVDNQGRELSKEQQEFFKDSKARDKNGNLVTVYHTTTDEMTPFYEFDPTGTEYYRFGDQVVNYYTDSKNMSGSYANQDYEMVNTKKVQSLDEVNRLINEHNKNLNPKEEYDYILELIDTGDGYELKVSTQPWVKEAREFYPRKYKDKTTLFKEIQEDINSYKTLRDKNGRTISKEKRWQYEGYVNIVNPYLVDAEQRNWNQVISQSNEFIDELEARVPERIKHELAVLYQRSADKSNDLRYDYDRAERLAKGTSEFFETNKNVEPMQKILNRLGIDKVNLIETGNDAGLGVDTYYALADILKEYNVIGNETSKLIIDDFKIPEEVRKWIKTNYNKKLKTKNMYPQVNMAEKILGKKETTLKELYENSNKAYEEFEKYRMPQDYFIEQISAEGNDYLGRELNDIFETRAELYSPERVGEEIAQAASVGFSKPEMIRLWGTSKTTNDVVKEIIASNMDGTTNYDGVIIKNVYDYGGKSAGAKTANDLYVTFNSNQFKAVDNLNPTNDPDIRYSKNSSEWQDYLERNYQATGTRTNMQDIKKGRRKRTKIENKGTPKLPEKSVKLLANNMKKTLGLNKNQVEDLMNQINEFYGNVDNVTRQEIYEYLDRNFSIQKVQETIQDVKEIQNFLRNYKIKVSDNIKSDIANYGDLRQRNFGKVRFSNDGSSVDTAYQELNKLYPEYFPEDIVNPTDQLLQIIDVANLENKQINETEIPENFIKEQAKYIYESLQDYELKQRQDYIESYGKEAFDIAYPKKKSRKTVREQLLDQMGITANDLSMGNDIKAINYQITDPIRVNEKVFGKELGQKINDATINQTKHNTAEKTRWLNEQRDEIKALGIKARSKESAAVQKLAEKQYTDANGTTLPYNEATLALEFPDVETQNKIKKAAEILRGKYDTYLDQLNGVLVDMGYDPIPKRKDYMRHFQELTDIFSTIGTPFNLKDMTANELPTDINGLTEQFKPGKNWFASAKPRLGLKTNYDAITGIDQYIEGAGNIIYHTADIQRYRALANMIRDTFGQTKGMENLEGLTEEEMQQRIKDIQDNKLNKYVAWLDEQANALAGKKGAIDRGTERALGRKAYSIMNTIKKQVGSNMTGFNVASSLTNFISTTIAAGKTNKIALAKGIVSTINNMFHNDGFANKSDFLTSRFGSDSLSQRWWNKASNAGQIFMTASDNITSNIITRSKYFEGLQKGMTEKQAIKYADDFAARVMGDRAQGSTAEIFNSKTLGLLTQFQLEVNNQWQYMVHDTRMDFKENATNKGKINAGATMVWQLGQIAGLSYLFNEVFQKLAGRRAAFDPIDILKKLFGLDDDDEEKDMNTRIQEALDELIDNIPFASVLTGGRIPIGEALPIKELITGKDDYGNDKARMETLKETLPYYILPTGYGQLKKMEAGAKMYDTNLPVAGSYTKSGNLRFTADTSTAGKIKNILFGQWSSKEAQDYLESGSSTITPQRIEEMKDLGMNSTQYRKYRKGLAEASTNDAKIDYIMGLNVDNTKKNIMANNVLQSSKYKFDAGEYKDFGSLDEYKEYKTNPEKYAAITQITDYNTYQGYKNDIKAIKDNTSNDKQETIEYINSLPLNIPQKAMFIRMYYPSYKNYNRQIIEYINNQDLTVEQKTNILRGNGFTVEDGRVY